MFLAALNQIKKFTLSPLTAGYCSNVRNAPTKDINEFRIVGTIRDSYTLISGRKSLSVQTYDKRRLKYLTHIVSINSDVNFTAGQRILATGKLRSVNREMSDGRRIASTVINPTKWFLLENGCENGSVNLTSADENKVELISHIASEVIHGENHSRFALVTHFERKNRVTGQYVGGVHFHRILVYDENVRRYVINNLKKTDRILLTGQFSHTVHTSQDGKKLYAGMVIAHSIEKIVR